ncbi:(2Fe-2S) ferredoxin domain-containing protein [Planktothricoides raciborskii GIHE-MW2]|uniref:(2Fe-2S) ferredoxin domain-containing protein n=2 Tax=Planktothricoides raciborskii TaxID=132608 RepID=A0AAU8J7N9_9CYAN|nr:(2Fe-2S) ferredoxin domain-containing protein [Planktothricoides raciborskii]
MTPINDPQATPPSMAPSMVESMAPSTAPSIAQTTYKCVSICQYQSCQRNGSAEVLAMFQQLRLPEFTVSGCGCLGQCSSGPTVKVNPDDVWYCRVKPTDVPEIIEQHLQEGKPVDRLLHPRIHPRFY